MTNQVPDKSNSETRVTQRARHRSRSLPGQSGTPSGLPRSIRHFREAFQDWTRQQVERVGKKQLLDLATNGKDEKNRLYAWRLICEYSYGKRAEVIDVP